MAVVAHRAAGLKSTLSRRAHSLLARFKEAHGLEPAGHLLDDHLPGATTRDLQIARAHEGRGEAPSDTREDVRVPLFWADAAIKADGALDELAHVITIRAREPHDLEGACLREASPFPAALAENDPGGKAKRCSV